MERDDDEKDERGGAGTSRSRGRAMAHRAGSSRGGVDVDIHAGGSAHDLLNDPVQDDYIARVTSGEFDVVIALYHDQGLAPLKTIDFDQAVNVTLGLPWVRTSPDHGTAFGLAGKGVASGTSFANAVAVARRLIVARGRRDSG